MDRIADELLGMLPTLLGAGTAIAFVFAGYLAIALDRLRADSPNRTDTQVGLKLVLVGFVLAGTIIAIGYTERVVAMMLGGFHDFVSVVKLAVPGVLVGAGVAMVVGYSLLPRTNASTSHQVERFALGWLGVVYGVRAMYGLVAMFDDVVIGTAWAETSSSLATAGIGSAVALLSVMRLGQRSGWSSAPPAPATAPQPPQPPPVAPQAPQAPQTPQGGGYYSPPSGGNPYAPR